MILEEHKNNKGIYGTIRLKFAIQKKHGLILNHKLIRRYKHILNIITIKRTKKGLSVSRAKEKSLVNKAQYIIDCNFNSDIPNQKYSSDVSYIKCKDGTLYLSAIKDYFNTEIVSFSTSNYNKGAEKAIKKYVHWYNNERIQKKLGYLSPLEYRLKYS